MQPQSKKKNKKTNLDFESLVGVKITKIDIFRTRDIYNN